MPKSWSVRLIFGLILTAGCFPAISTSLQQEAGPRVSFAELSTQPDQYKGHCRFWGARS